MRFSVIFWAPKKQASGRLALLSAETLLRLMTHWGVGGAPRGGPAAPAVLRLPPALRTVLAMLYALFLDAEGAGDGAVLSGCPAELRALLPVLDAELAAAVEGRLARQARPTPAATVTF
jgi:hypothetical protein